MSSSPLKEESLKSQACQTGRTVQYIPQQAPVLGAVGLPGSAFQENAGERGCSGPSPTGVKAAKLHRRRLALLMTLKAALSVTGPVTLH